MTKQLKQKLVGLYIAVSALIIGSAHAEIVIPQDAVVGLVLSGGGARGLAHVGVIRVLEAEGIQPQIVTGTSMGSIVGALYASGRSAAEIDRIARNMNWQTALSDASPRSDQPYPFRELEAGMNTDVRMSINKNGIAFPKGVIEGQHLEQELGELFQLEGKPLQFADLTRRYAAVAADLETGEAVIMNSGDVATAVRASMSIPGAIAPVDRDGLLLVDGGIANNMPVDLARKMGATFIIAVDVTAPLKKRDQLDSLFSIATQTTAFLVRLNTLEQRVNLRQDEILILPSLDGLGSAEFDKFDTIIDAGFQAALQTFDVESEQLELLEGDVEISDKSSPIISYVRIINNSVVSDDVIRAQIRQRLGQPFDRKQLERDLSRIYGLDYFSVVRYRLIENGDESGLEVTGVARDTGNSWLKLGLELADDFRGNSVVGLSTSVRAAGLNEYGGTAFGRMVLGTIPELEFRYLQPLTADLKYFIEPALGYKADQLDIYLDDFQPQPLSEYQKQDRWGAIAFGRSIWDGAGELRVGAVRQRGNLKFRSGLELGELEADNQNYDDGFYYGRIGWDTLDDLGFPNHGQRWSLSAEQHRTNLRAESDFTRVDLEGSFAFSVGRSTLLLEGDAQVSDSDTASFIDIPFIGGFLELSGLPPHSRFGRHRVLIRCVYYHRLDKNGPLPLGVPLYIGGSLERGNVWLERDNISWKNAIGAGSLFLGARTPLGPAYFSIGLTEEDDHSVSIFLGQRFR